MYIIIKTWDDGSDRFRFYAVTCWRLYKVPQTIWLCFIVWEFLIYFYFIIFSCVPVFLFFTLTFKETHSWKMNLLSLDFPSKLHLKQISNCSSESVVERYTGFIRNKRWIQCVLLCDPVTWRHLPGVVNVESSASSSSVGCSPSWHSSLRRCQSDAAPAGVGHCGGGSCRSGVTPSESPSLPAATLLSCSEHSKHTLSCLISQQRQQQPLLDICWHVAGEKIVGASQFLMRTKPSFPLRYVAVLILLVMRQHCWSYLTKAKASSHFSKLQRVNKLRASLQ